MTELFSAMGLVLAIEGALYAAFPGLMRRALASIGTQPDSTLRSSGMLALIAGVVVVWLVRG